MQLAELIQRIQSLYSKGVQSDDSRLSSRHIYNKLLTVRSRLITQQANKKQAISVWNYQTLSCIELVKVPAHECPCAPPLGCEILRSKYKIPGIISGIFGDLIQTVSTVDRGIKFDRVTINSVNYQKGNKYTSNKLQYFLHNDYLYITSNRHLGVVMLTGVFEDPVEASKFQSYCECKEGCTDCIDYQELDFPLDTNLLDQLIELSLQELLEIFMQVPEDVTNNSRDSLKEQSK